MEDPIRIEIRKVLFAVTSPQIIIAPSALRKNRPLALKPELKNFILDIVIKENLKVRFTEWAKPLQGAVYALAALPTIESLKIRVSFESQIRSVGEDAPRTIPEECIAMIQQSFRRLRGVAHAEVSDLGADRDDEALVAHLTATRRW